MCYTNKCKELERTSPCTTKFKEDKTMRIIKSNKELTTKERYKLTMDPTIGKMKDAIGSRLSIEAWAVYEDTNSDGKEQTILSILTKDGEVFATNSPTFLREFQRLNELFEDAGETVEAVEVVSGTSKNGREYITVTLAE